VICGVSSEGIDVQVVLGVLGLAAATFSTVWATGGWSAIRRRSIQQELDLANDLPASSAARARLTTHVEDEIEIYLYRIREQPPQTIGRPLSRVGLGFLILAPIAIIFPDANIIVIVVIEVLFIAMLVAAYAVIMRSWWIKRSRRRRHDLLEEARKVADTPAAADGQQVELT
jgi:hypothetical protein